MQKDHRIRPEVPDFTPVPRKCARHDGWTPERQRAFIEALADTGSVKHAARTVGMAPEGAYQLRRQPGAEEFAAAWEAAVDHGIRQLEDIAMDRAINGVEVPVYSYGKLVGTRIVHNDRLVMFMLRNRLPDRFGSAALRRKTETSPEMQQQLRLEWEKEKAIERQKEHEDLGPRIKAEIAKVRERIMSQDERDYQDWQHAKSQGRAVILPEEEPDE